MLFARPIADIRRGDWCWVQKRAHHHGVDATSNIGAHAAPPAWGVGCVCVRVCVCVCVCVGGGGFAGGLHGLCWHVLFRRSRVDIYIYIHLPFRSHFFCVWSWPIRPSLAFLLWHLFSTDLSGSWKNTVTDAWLSFLFFVRSCNCSWPVATGRTTSRDIVQQVARPIVSPVWPRPVVDRHDWWYDWSYDHYTTHLRPPAIWNRRNRVLNMTVDLATNNLPLAITHDLYDQSYALSAIPPWFPFLSVVPRL